MHKTVVFDHAAAEIELQAPYYQSDFILIMPPLGLYENFWTLLNHINTFSVCFIKIRKHFSDNIRF